LLEAFEAESGKDTKGSPDHEGFFAKVAAFFEGGRG
jgi:molecular chaperone DnaJ